MAWRKFGAHRQVLCDRGYPLNQRLRLFNTVVTPVVLYGSASWTMTKTREQTLRSAQRKMLRSIIGKGRRKVEHSEDHSSTSLGGSVGSQETEDEDSTLESFVDWIRRVTHEAEEAMERVSIPDWIGEQRRRKWKWARKVASCADGRWSKKILNFVPVGNRKRAHPKARWTDQLENLARSMLGEKCRDAAFWMQLAQDEEVWQQLEEDLCNR